MNIELFLEQEIEKIKNQDRLRVLKDVSSPHEKRIVINGKDVLNFCSNSYLDMSNNIQLKEYAQQSIKKWGIGSGSARLIGGNLSPLGQLEEKIAKFKKRESALVFSTGYHANVGIISALIGKEDEIFSDEFNHASIIDGCRLSKAKTKIYEHKNMENLEELLKNSSANKKLIVTDSVFSMDGDIAPLSEIVELSEKYGSIIMIDEAHATGVFGPNGEGLAVELGLENKIDIQMGTLGKAIGVFGAYVTGSNNLIKYLVNRSRSFIFTTGVPAVIADTARKSIEIIENSPELIKNLWKNIDYFNIQANYHFKGNNKLLSPIVPVIVGTEKDTMDITEFLLSKGIFLQGIRPPTVQEGTSRLRISLMSSHTQEEISFLIETLKEAEEKFKLKLNIGI